MPRFNVHIYAIVRVTVLGVEAEDAVNAALIADTSTDGEYAGSVDGYMVDPVDSLGEQDGDSITLTAELKREDAVQYRNRHNYR